MIFLFLNLFYEHDKTINQHFQIQNHFLLSILSLRFGNYLRFIYYLSSLIMSPVSLPDLISSLSLCTSFSCIFRRNKIYMHIYLNFSFVRFISNSLMIICYITKVWHNLVNLLLYWLFFVFISSAFIIFMIIYKITLTNIGLQ